MSVGQSLKIYACRRGVRGPKLGTLGVVELASDVVVGSTVPLLHAQEPVITGEDEFEKFWIACGAPYLIVGLRVPGDEGWIRVPGVPGTIVPEASEYLFQEHGFRVTLVGLRPDRSSGCHCGRWACRRFEKTRRGLRDIERSGKGRRALS